MPHTPATSVVIYSPAALYREAWRVLLAEQPGIVVAGTLSDLTRLAPLLDVQPPAALLLDVPTPDPTLARQCKTITGTPGLLFLVWSYELPDILALLRAGATGCLSRDVSPGELSRALIAVGRGELVLPPVIAARALMALAQSAPTRGELIEPLSGREEEVLCLLARGSTNKEIAQTLILSVRTVEAHLRSIFPKLGVGSRTEAALWAVRHGYDRTPTASPDR